MSTEKLTERLESSELVVFPTCPFPLPNDNDRQFLFDQEVASGGHKNISYDPLTTRLGGYRSPTPQAESRMQSILAGFSQTAIRWLSAHLSDYAKSWEIGRASFRPEEEATRPLRFTARNDLLHIDNFPTRPTHGRRLLRLFVNLNPSEPRVWVTSESFPELMTRFAPELHIPTRTIEEWCRPASSWLRLWNRDQTGGSHYDSLMLRLHHAMKSSEKFQDRARRKVWSLAPGSMWLLFADGLAHGVLRGQFALEHSFYVPVEALRQPERSPLRILEQIGREQRRRAG